MLRDIDIPQHSKLWQTSFTFQAPDYMAKGWYWTEFFFWAWTCKFWSQFLLSFHLVQNFSNFDENNKFQIFEWQIRRNEIKVKDERQPNLLSTIIEFLVYVFFSHKKIKIYFSAVEAGDRPSNAEGCRVSMKLSQMKTWPPLHIKIFLYF